MARKKTLDENACKFSLDISGSNKSFLDSLTENYGLKHGPMINHIIKTIFTMPSRMINAIDNACLAEYHIILSELEQAEYNSLHRLKLETELNSFNEFLKLIHNGIFSAKEKVINEPGMQCIELADGHAILPEEWIIVNHEMAKNCKEVAILECRNAQKYNIPIFVYFTNIKYAKDYDENMCEDFYSRCQMLWPNFAEIRELSDRNELKRDPDYPGNYLNVEAYLNAPTIGLFNLYEESEYPGEQPYGAKIVRKTKSK